MARMGHQPMPPPHPPTHAPPKFKTNSMPPPPPNYRPMPPGQPGRPMMPPMMGNPAMGQGHPMQPPGPSYGGMPMAPHPGRFYQPGAVPMHTAHLPHGAPTYPPQKPKKVFSLGNQPESEQTGSQEVKSNEGNLMEDFLRESRNYNVFYPYNFRDNYPNEESRRRIISEFRNRMNDMKVNPKSYFNFGFTLQDYLQYISKHYFVRLERDMIKHSGETYNGK